MSDKLKKIDKTFVLSDSSVNCYGFRLLSKGLVMDKFQSNPIGYYMHQREAGVVVRWENLRLDGDKVKAEPCINLSNAKGQQIVDEIEHGFLNAASVGHIVVLESSTDEALMLPGQTGPTITKWYPRETSLVDIPGNESALIQLFDQDGNLMNLSSFKLTTAHIPATPSQRLEERPTNVNDICLFKEWDELYSEGLLPALKQRNLDLYKLKFKRQFGKYPKEGAEANKEAAHLMESLLDNAERNKLCNMSYSELHKKGLLSRLKEIDESAYQGKLRE